MLENHWLRKIVPDPVTQLDPTAYQRYSIVSTLLFLTSTAMLFFSLYNIFISGLYFEAWASGLGAIVGFSFLWYLRRSLKIEQVALSAMLAFAGFLLVFDSVNQNHSFGMVWNLFFPVYALLALGRASGLKYAILFYCVWLALAVYGLDAWPDSQWDQTSLLRLSIAYFLLTYVVSTSERENDVRHEQSSVNYERERRHAKEFKILSITDPLTGLFNRRHFMDESQNIVKQMYAEQTHLVMFILDVDDFKLYNDTYGHQQGDEALKSVARVLKENCFCDQCRLFRLGGEEFGGFFLSNNPEKAVQDLDGLREAVFAHKLPHKASLRKVLTVSIGVEIVSPKDFLSMNDVYKMADIALYQAKESGRNKTVLYQEK